MGCFFGELEGPDGAQKCGEKPQSFGCDDDEGCGPKTNTCTSKQSNTANQI